MKIRGKQEFLAVLADLPEAVKAEARKALTVSAEETTDLMRRFAPVDSGRLKSSIGYRFGNPDGATGFMSAGPAGDARAAKGEAGLAVTMYAGGHPTTVEARKAAGAETFDYATAVEFGTRTMRSRPFFFPAYRLMRKRARARIARAVRTGAQRAFKK